MVVAAVPISAPAAEAAKPHEFHNCAAVNEVYPHGIAKNFKVFKMANGLTGRPFVGTKLYAAQPRTLDRDKDGVACETLAVPSSFWFRTELDPAEACRFGTGANVMLGDAGTEVSITTCRCRPPELRRARAGLARMGIRAPRCR